MLNALTEHTLRLGKPRWKDMLLRVAQLHEERVHPPFRDIPFMWEETGILDEDQAFFGHWESVHQALDTVGAEPKHTWHQVRNLLTFQLDNGMIPGRVLVTDSQTRYSSHASCPPLWPYVVELYRKASGDSGCISYALDSARKQIEWFCEHRACEGGGFYYVDLLDRQWESGMAEARRADLCADEVEPSACVDASCHMYSLLDHGIRWACELGQDSEAWEHKLAELKHFIQNTLYDADSAFFYDCWALRQPEKRYRGCEGLWPLIVGAASGAQAAQVIDEQLCHPSRFFAKHPLPSMAMDEPFFDLSGWKGAARNSLVYWASIGCVRYRRPEVASRLLEAALDSTLEVFDATGSLWEFYDPEARFSPSELGGSARNSLGHNPLIAMAELYDQVSG